MGITNIQIAGFERETEEQNRPRATENSFSLLVLPESLEPDPTNPATKSHMPSSGYDCRYLHT